MAATAVWPQLTHGALVDVLRARQNADGGWGAAAGLTSNTECTALALLAIRETDQMEHTDAVSLAAGTRWLLARQEVTGAWRYDDAGPTAPWPTPIALLALRRWSAAKVQVERGFSWLLRQEGEAFPWRLRIREFVTRRRVNVMDSTLAGWPWLPGTFAWVEPTAWALLALKAMWPSHAPRAVRGRLREGEAMILDRACRGGGWNYGNVQIYDEILEPYPDTTALALLGLIGREAPAIDEGFDALDRLLGEHASGLALSLAALSRRRWARDANELQRRIGARFKESGFMGETRATALGALATAPRLDWLGDSPHA